MRRKGLKVFFLLVALILCGCRNDAPVATDSVVTDPPVSEPMPTETIPLQTEMPFTGWAEIDGETVYLDGDVLCTGWLELEDGTYYLDEYGHKVTGWVELNGRNHYFLSDGRAAQGKQMLDETVFYFSSKGEQIVLVNQWNPLPWDYNPEITEAVNGCYVAKECADALHAMLTDLKDAVGTVGLLNGYRNYTMQYQAFYGSIDNMVRSGTSYHVAYSIVKQSLAIPGTSEHQLGLAVDVMDPNDLFYDNGETEVIHWLKEHCWDYGFIMRYPEGKSHITGIVFEPWHYRYIGVEIAQELKDSGLCLEEYLDQLTNDGTTCGDPNALSNE